MTLRSCVLLAVLVATTAMVPARADAADDPNCAVLAHPPILVAARYTHYVYTTGAYNAASESASLGKAGRIAIAYFGCQDSVTETISFIVPTPATPRDAQAWAATARMLLSGLAVDDKGAGLVKDLVAFLDHPPAYPVGSETLYFCNDGTQNPSGCDWSSGGSHTFAIKPDHANTIVTVGRDFSF